VRDHDDQEAVHECIESVRTIRTRLMVCAAFDHGGELGRLVADAMDYLSLAMRALRRADEEEAS
jgi:hypothetical protein